LAKDKNQNQRTTIAGKVSECSPKTTKARVNFITFLVASENLPIAIAPGGLHTHATDPAEFYEGLPFGGVEVSCSSDLE
jgi:hypothetical protein